MCVCVCALGADEVKRYPNHRKWYNKVKINTKSNRSQRVFFYFAFFMLFWVRVKTCACTPTTKYIKLLSPKPTILSSICNILISQCLQQLAILIVLTEAVTLVVFFPSTYSLLCYGLIFHWWHNELSGTAFFFHKISVRFW